jgi:hypothetical protein
VECSGTHHRLIWQAGQLTAPAHPDVDAERALAALGGASCGCLDLLTAWHTHAEDPRVLVLGPRGPKIAVVHPDDGRGRQGMAIYSYAPGSPPVPSALGLEDLLVLRGGLTRRLIATSASALISRNPDGPMSRQLHAALYGRLLVSLGRWLGELPELELELIGPGAEPSLSVDGSTVRAAVAPDWLIDVWGAGLEIVADRFTLAASYGNDADPRVRLRSVDQLLAVGTTTVTTASAQADSSGASVRPASSSASQ